MELFESEFYSSRIDEWSMKYIKIKELKKLIKLIARDIADNGGPPELLKRCPSNTSTQPDSMRESSINRATIGLSLLKQNGGLFSNNLNIFGGNLMEEISETFGNDLAVLDYEKDAKIFLYFLEVEVHNVYVFYLSIEKELFQKTNTHLKRKKNYMSLSNEALLSELTSLIDIAYSTYSFFLYTDLNIEAIEQILQYFDDYFSIVNKDVNLRKLYFSKNIAKKESDLKYILSFKIIIECSTILEACSREIREISPEDKKIKEKLEELDKVLSYINEKDTTRLSEKVNEIYVKGGKNTIIKQKKDIDYEIQNSFIFDVTKAGDVYAELEQKDLDDSIKIQITKKNKINLFFCFLLTFIYSFYYITPYLTFHYLFMRNAPEEEKKKEIDKQNLCENIYLIGLILTFTHIGSFLSKIIFRRMEKFKCAFVYFCLFRLTSHLIITLSIFRPHNISAELVATFCLARFIYGFGNGGVIIRKYILLFVPESLMRKYSMIYIISKHSGLFIGVVFNFVTSFAYPKLTLFGKDTFDEYIVIFFVGAILNVILLLFVIFMFTEPSIKGKNSMLVQQSKEKTGKELNFIESESDDEGSVNNIKNSNTLISSNNDMQDSNKLNIEAKQEISEELSERVRNAKEMEGLISIEDSIKRLNQEGGFVDTNLLSQEIERISKNQFSGNSYFKSSVIILSITLILTKMINEYLFYFMPKSQSYNDYDPFPQSKAWCTGMILFMITLSFPFIIVYRMYKNIQSELKIFYYSFFLLVFFMTGFVIIMGFYYKKYKDEDSVPDEDSFTWPSRIIFAFLFLLNCILDNCVYLLVYKLIPTFVKICNVNTRYIISYASIIGKLLGGIIYIVVCYADKNDEKYIYKYTYLWGPLAIDVLVLIFAIIFLVSRKSLQVRAVAKLKIFT